MSDEPSGRGLLDHSKAKLGRRRTRRRFDQTAAEFLLGLLKGRKLTTAEVNAAWKKAGRGGKADVTLMQLVKAKKLKRAKVKGGRGSRYGVM